MVPSTRVAPTALYEGLGSHNLTFNCGKPGSVLAVRNHDVQQMKMHLGQKLDEARIRLQNMSVGIDWLNALERLQVCG